MTYVLAPSAARDLEILWQHLADEASEAIADRVSDAISERCEMLADLVIVSSRLAPTSGRKWATHPLGHPAIECESAESDDASLPYERHLAPVHAVVEGVAAHAQIASRRVHVEPATIG
jgi:plasmid stabilization system protein ParE